MGGGRSPGHKPGADFELENFNSGERREAPTILERAADPARLQVAAHPEPTTRTG